MKCFAKCDTADILKPLNLEVKDLLLNGRKSKPEYHEIEAVYHYDGFEAVPTKPKYCMIMKTNIIIAQRWEQAQGFFY